LAGIPEDTYTAIEFFIDELINFLYIGYAPDIPWKGGIEVGGPWGLSNPPLICSGTREGGMSACNSCCVPDEVVNPNYNSEDFDYYTDKDISDFHNPEMLQIRPACCDGSCGVSSGTCSIPVLRHYPGRKDVFDSQYQDWLDSSDGNRTVSFIEAIGRDDEVKARRREFHKPDRRSPAIVEHIEDSRPEPDWRIEDTEGYYNGFMRYPMEYPNYSNDGIYRFFYELRDWGLELPRVWGLEDGKKFTEENAKLENCFWYDWEYFKIDMLASRGPFYNVDCEELIEAAEGYFVMPWKLEEIAGGEDKGLSLSRHPFSDDVICEKRPYVDNYLNPDLRGSPVDPEALTTFPGFRRAHPLLSDEDRGQADCTWALAPDKLEMPGTLFKKGLESGGEEGRNFDEEIVGSIVLNPQGEEDASAHCAQYTVRNVNGPLDRGPDSPYNVIGLGIKDTGEMIWRPGSDMYCGDWPYGTSCTRHNVNMKGDGPCTERSWEWDEEDKNYVVQGPYVDAECMCRDEFLKIHPEPRVNPSESQGSAVGQWQEDIVDDIAYGLRDFADWAEGLLSGSREEIVRDLFVWYDTVAQWIEPMTNNCYNQPTERRNCDTEDHGFCYQCYNDENVNKKFDGGETAWGNLWEYLYKIEAFWNRLARYKRYSFVSEDCFEAWCVPMGEGTKGSVKGNEPCLKPLPAMSPPPAVEEWETFDGNANDVRGDIQDVKKINQLINKKFNRGVGVFGDARQTQSFCVIRGKTRYFINLRISPFTGEQSIPVKIIHILHHYRISHNLCQGCLNPHFNESVFKRQGLRHVLIPHCSDTGLNHDRLQDNGNKSQDSSNHPKKPSKWGQNKSNN